MIPQVDPQYDNRGHVNLGAELGEVTSEPKVAITSDDNAFKPDDSGAQFADSFSEKAIRMAFIRKVYAILMVQLAITVGFISIFVFSQTVKDFLNENMWMLLVALLIQIVLIVSITFCSNVRRKFPLNLICLLMFTVAEGFFLGACCSCFEANEVLYAAGICSFICLGLTIYAFQTRYDFTLCGGMLYVTLLVFVIFGCLAFPMRNELLSLVYSCIGVLIFSIYLVYDTQLLMGGKHKYAITPEEYIFAALSLYLDIVNLFIYILQIVAGRN